MFTYWYILQTRELKRFFQQEDANQKEYQAIAKEVEVTNVLNHQQDGVIIVSMEESENPLYESSNSHPSGTESFQIEFSNLKGVELFGIDKTELSQA